MSPKRVLKVPGRYDQIKRIVAFVAAGANAAGLDEDAVFHVELCCDEACTNIIEHAYGGEDRGAILASYDILPDAFQITLKDFGRTFDPAAVPPPALPPRDRTSDGDPDPKRETDFIFEQLQIGGLGVHFMRKLMDEVHFEFDADAGNTLTMIKKMPS